MVCRSGKEFNSFLVLLWRRIEKAESISLKIQFSHLCLFLFFFTPTVFALVTLGNMASLVNVPKNEVSSAWSSVKWPLVLAGKASASRMYMRSGLIRKDLLPKYDRCGGIPETTVCHDYAQLVEFCNEKKRELGGDCEKESSGRYVVKYSDSSNAYGLILLTLSPESAYESCLSRIKRNFELDGSSRVVQRYIPPYLVTPKRSKFHLRLLVMCVGKMDCFAFDEVRVLISPEKYREEVSVGGVCCAVEETRGAHDDSISDNNGDDVNDDLINDDLVMNTLHAHITNQSFNVSHPDYNESVHNIPLHLCEELNNGDNWEDGGKGIWSQMMNICRSTFRELGKDGKKFLALPNTYEVFGLDFLLDSERNVYLLEANPEPSLGMFHKTREEIIGAGDPLGLTEPDWDGQGWVKFYSMGAEKAMERMKKMVATLRQEKEVRTELRPPWPTCSLFDFPSVC